MPAGIKHPTVIRLLASGSHGCPPFLTHCFQLCTDGRHCEGKHTLGLLFSLHTFWESFWCETNLIWFVPNQEPCCITFGDVAIPYQQRRRPSWHWRWSKARFPAGSRQTGRSARPPRCSPGKEELTASHSVEDRWRRQHFMSVLLFS